jgi:hypothetical protein
VDETHESVDKMAARLWRRDFSTGTTAIRLLAIPGELASGGAIRRRRSLGIFFADRVEVEAFLHYGCAVDGVLKKAARLWTSSSSIGG